MDGTPSLIADEKYLACLNAMCQLARDLAIEAIEGGTDKREAFNSMISASISAACWLHVTNYDSPGRKEIFMKVVSDAYDELAMLSGALKTQTSQ